MFPRPCGFDSADSNSAGDSTERLMAARSGERKLQILQTLAAMLEKPRGEKITTAALAARLSVSEAALYRHFASKAQMFEVHFFYLHFLYFPTTLLLFMQ